jgi:ABC-2 type transport system permease protein
MRPTANGKKSPTNHLFSSGRVMIVTWRVLKQVSRDRRTLAMMIIGPFVIMLVFGFALGGQVKNVPILVDNRDQGYSPTVNATRTNLGDQIVSSLRVDGAVRVVPGNYTSGKSGVNDGTYSASILIPQNFSESVVLSAKGLGVSSPIVIYIDGTKPSIEASVLGALQRALQSTVNTGGVSLDKQFAFGGVQYSGLDVSIPDVIAFILTFLVLFISLIMVSRESVSGTLARLYVAPLSSLERLLGYSLALLSIAIIMATVILATGIGVFGVVVRGSVFLLFFGAVLYALSQVFLSVTLANFARNELQAIQLGPLIALPSMVLSGMLFPVNSFPTWIQVIAKFVPMFYANMLFEGIMLKGYGVVQLAPELLIIGGMASLFFVLAAATLKDRIVA